MRIVKVQGGAGNQLFQASHVYSMLTDAREPVVLYTGSLGRYRKKQDLFDQAWAMLNIRVKNGVGVRLVLKLANRISWFERVLKQFGIECIDGYFHENFDVEYAKAAKIGIENAGQFGTAQQGVVHCRGGDYLEPPNDEIYWQLKFEDYSGVLVAEDISSDWVVLGNHAELIPKFEKLGADFLQGSIVDDLATIGAAKQVVCSNSTFAFWGAVLCALNGGQVRAPARYYRKDIAPNPFECLARRFPDQVTMFGENDA